MSVAYHEHRVSTRRETGYATAGARSPTVFCRCGTTASWIPLRRAGQKRTAAA
jgi:hypothetical protein